MKKKSILIINRWNDEMSCYEDYIDHRKHHVFYLTNQKGSKRIKTELAKDIYITNYLDNIYLDSNFDAFIKKLPFIDNIIAFSEVDQELAACLRTKLSVQGVNDAEVKKFRNKVEMKYVARQAGICVPNFTELSDELIFSSFIDQISYPIILKPKNGVSSEGVYKVTSKEKLSNLLPKIDASNYECEQFIEGKIYHADGLVQNGCLLIFKVSAYINNCFEYTLGKPLGSVVIDDQLFIERAKEFTYQIIDAFLLHTGAFHLEFIIDKNNKIYFLEIGARVGGAQVPYVFKHVYGINLFHEWVNLQIDLDLSIKNYNKLENYIGGWLLFPQPKDVPCKVEERYPLKKTVPCIISETLPEIGHVFYGDGEYRDVSGTYLYKGQSTKKIKASINQTINQFNLKTTSIN